MAHLDDVISHASSITSWLQLPETKIVLEWQRRRLADAFKDLKQANDIVAMARAQGEIYAIEKLLDLAMVVDPKKRKKE